MKTDAELLQELFSRPIAFHRALARAAGSAAAGLFLSQLNYWSERSTHCDGWVYKSAREWTDETCLTVDEQRGARKMLLSKGLIEEARGADKFDRLSKFDKSLCYRIDFAKLLHTLRERDESPVPSRSGIAPDRDGKKPHRQPENTTSTKGFANSQTEITSETTAKTTTAFVVVGKAAKHTGAIDVAASSARLTDKDAQRLVDAFAGALLLPPVDKGYPMKIGRWLQATAQALAAGEFVENSTYERGRALRTAALSQDPARQAAEQKRHHDQLERSADTIRQQILAGAT